MPFTGYPFTVDAEITKPGLYDLLKCEEQVFKQILPGKEMQIHAMMGFFRHQNQVIVIQKTGKRFESLTDTSLVISYKLVAQMIV